MALLDDVMKGSNLTTALMVGLGALIVWPLISPIVRSLTKSIIKGGVLAYRQTEQLYLGVAEGIGEILAESPNRKSVRRRRHGPTGAALMPLDELEPGTCRRV